MMSSNGQIDIQNKVIENFRRDLKKSSEEIELRIKMLKECKYITPDDIKMLSIEDPFTLSSPVEDHYGIEKIEDLVNNLDMKKTKVE